MNKPSYLYYEPLRGAQLPHTRIAKEDLSTVFEMRKRGYLQKEIAETFGVGQSQISRILNRNRRAVTGLVLRPNLTVGAYNWQKKHFRKKRCERCPSKKNLALHHRDRNRTNWNKKNLETLCRPCHILEHHDEVVERNKRRKR